MLAGLISCEKKDKTESVTDIDGNEYQTVSIGTQLWMAENLRVKNYNDGTPIPLIAEDSEWASLTSPGFCWYENDESSDKDPYGALDNCDAGNTCKVCPQGWHVPTNEDWDLLIEYLGGDTLAGGELKETDTLHWLSPNEGATGRAGFQALPGGGHYFNGNYGWMGYYGTYWSATENSSSTANTSYMRYNSKRIYRESYGKNTGYSVRCVKD